MTISYEVATWRISLVVALACLELVLFLLLPNRYFLISLLEVKGLKIGGFSFFPPLLSFILWAALTLIVLVCIDSF